MDYKNRSRWLTFQLWFIIFDENIENIEMGSELLFNESVEVMKIPEDRKLLLVLLSKLFFQVKYYSQCW